MRTASGSGGRGHAGSNGGRSTGRRVGGEAAGRANDSPEKNKCGSCRRRIIGKRSKLRRMDRLCWKADDSRIRRSAPWGCCLGPHVTGFRSTARMTRARREKNAKPGPSMCSGISRRTQRRRRMCTCVSQNAWCGGEMEAAILQERSLSPVRKSLWEGFAECEARCPHECFRSTHCVFLSCNYLWHDFDASSICAHRQTGERYSATVYCDSWRLVPLWRLPACTQFSQFPCRCLSRDECDPSCCGRHHTVFQCMRRVNGTWNGFQDKCMSQQQREIVEADAGWWHPWHGLHEQTRVPREALFVRIPHAPLYFASLEQRDEAAARSTVPRPQVRPVWPYDAYAAVPQRGTGGGSSSSTRQ